MVFKKFTNIMETLEKQNEKMRQQMAEKAKKKELAEKEKELAEKEKELAEKEKELAEKEKELAEKEKELAEKEKELAEKEKELAEKEKRDKEKGKDNKEFKADGSKPEHDINYLSGCVLAHELFLTHLTKNIMNDGLIEEDSVRDIISLLLTTGPNQSVEHPGFDEGYGESLHNIGNAL